MKNVFLILLGLLAVLFSCKNKNSSLSVSYIDNKQVLQIDSSFNGIGIVSPDTILTGEELIAKIYFTNKKYKLIGAYFDFDKENLLVDTTTNELLNNNKKLYIEKDTVIIAFKSNKENSLNKFHDILLLTKDERNIYIAKICTFHYFVKKGLK
jgi:hypothetical protein